MNKYKWIIKVWAVLASLLLIGCTGANTLAPKQDKLVLPAITKTATEKHYSGKFVWHDLLTDDVDKAKEFYSGLFGWSFEDKHGYTTIYHHGKVIGGMMHVSHTSDKNVEAVWLPSLSVENVDNAIAEVKAKKGTVLKGPIDMPQRGRGVLVSDAQGAHIVLLHAKGGDPLDTVPNMGDWLWNELWTSNSKESEALYRRLGKYDAVSKSGEYRIFKNKGKWRAGIRDVSKEDAKSRWVSVVRVSDLQKSMDKVKHLGGQVLMNPHKEIADGNVAVIADNTGALLLIQRWSGSVKEGGK
jgi:predicted enzyme related to lactoylglutathione lyase